MSELNWDSIYQEYSGKVMGYISARVQRRADAEDLCSEVFEKVFRKMEGYDQEKASVGTWIYTITRNTVIDYFRKNRPTAELDENIASDGEVDDSLLNNETLSELAQGFYCYSNACCSKYHADKQSVHEFTLCYFSAHKQQCSARSKRYRDKHAYKCNCACGNSALFQILESCFKSA